MSFVLSRSVILLPFVILVVIVVVGGVVVAFMVAADDDREASLGSRQTTWERRGQHCIGRRAIFGLSGDATFLGLALQVILRGWWGSGGTLV